MLHYFVDIMDSTATWEVCDLHVRPAATVLALLLYGLTAGKPASVHRSSGVSVSPGICTPRAVSYLSVQDVLARTILLARYLALAFSASVVGSRVAGRVFGLGTADTLVHHVHAFTIHVTALILLKGLLFARGSRLVPDKARLGFRFPCDGPGRGGT